MKSILHLIAVLAAGVGLMLTIDGCQSTSKPVVVLETSEGNIEVELFPEVAPKHVENFLNLVRQGFYDSLVFHRVIDGFMIQTGDPKGDGTGGSGSNVPAEFNDSLHHVGTLGMARSADPNSASSQFYICVADAHFLDHQYTVFGRTIVGLDVVKRIGKVPTSGNMQKIMGDPNWKQELLRLKKDEGGDIMLMPDGTPAPDRPLKKVILRRAYEKK